MLVMMLISLPFFAQTGGELVGGDTSVVLDFTTFTGIAAVVSMLVTQLCKLVPKISSTRWLKIIIAFASGVVICLLTKLLGITSPLLELSWGATAIYGLFAGSVSAGLFDLIKMIYDLFFKKSATT